MRAPSKLLIDNLSYESKISCASQCFDQNVIPILCSIHCLCRSTLWHITVSVNLYCMCDTLCLEHPQFANFCLHFHSMLAITQSAPWLLIELHARTQDYLPKHSISTGPCKSRLYCRIFLRSYPVAQLVPVTQLQLTCIHGQCVLSDRRSYTSVSTIISYFMCSAKNLLSNARATQFR